MTRRARTAAPSPVRFREPGYGWPAAWPLLVRCPRCDRRARIDADPAVRLLCPACGLARAHDPATLYTTATDDGSPIRVTLVTKGYGRGRSFEDADGRHRAIAGGEAFDPYFNMTFWLLATCCGGHLLWARNGDHLAYLRAYVAGELREDGRADRSRQALSHRLPTWLKLARNRDEILRHVDRLAATLQD